MRREKRKKRSIAYIEKKFIRSKCCPEHFFWKLFAIVFLWTRTMQFWQPYWKIVGSESKNFVNLVFFRKYFFLKCSNEHVECSFANPAGNFDSKSEKKSLVIFVSKRTQKMFLWARRNEFWQYHFLVDYSIFCVNSVPPCTLVCLSFSWIFQWVQFRAISYPPSTENIAALLHLLFFLFFIALMNLPPQDGSSVANHIRRTSDATSNFPSNHFTQKVFHHRGSVQMAHYGVSFSKRNLLPSITHTFSVYQIIETRYT